MTLVIGDIHNRAPALEAILGDVWDKSEPILFLGDINDNKHSLEEGYDFKRVYLLVRTLVDSGKAKLIYSNHQDKLIRALKGNKVTHSHGLNQTWAQVETWTQEERDSLRDWLAQQPLVVEDGNFVYAHAYPSQHKSLAIFGPKDSLNLREEWWLDEKWQDKGKTFVAGHYHKSFDGPWAILVDADDDEEAIAWARLPQREYGKAYV